MLLLGNRLVVVADAGDALQVRLHDDCTLFSDKRLEILQLSQLRTLRH